MISNRSISGAELRLNIDNRHWSIFCGCCLAASFLFRRVAYCSLGSYTNIQRLAHGVFAAYFTNRLLDKKFRMNSK